MKISLGLSLIALLLSACGIGSPYSVETRSPTAASLEQEAIDEKVWAARRVERAKGEAN